MQRQISKAHYHDNSVSKMNRTLIGGQKTHIDFHSSVQPIGEDEVMGHTYSVGLHGMTLSIVKVANVL